MYKVIRKSGSKMYSLNSNGFYELEYKLDSWTEPKIGKIFIFKELADAISFKAVMQYPFRGIILEIYTCEVENAAPMERCAMCIGQSITKFWKGKTKPYHDQRTPKGTYGADKVKLLEKI